MILDGLTVDKEDVRLGTGWELKPEGACKGAVCVPLPPEATANGSVDVRILAERLGMPLLHDEGHDVWVLGPESLTGRALTTAEAPELVLPDLNREPFSLSSLRGQKVVLTAWASW